MKTIYAIGLAILVLFCASLGLADGDTKVEQMTFSGPYTHDNLSVFVVHDPTAKNEEEILTLEEGLKKRSVKVKETGNVNELLVDNTGKNPVFLSAGEIVKGGRQDRVLQHDTILPPGTKGTKIGVFCVEAGRWSGRSGEASTHFGSSSEALVTRAQKLAVKVSGQQGEVWKAVSQAQDELSKKLGKSVKSPRSASSLQLSLEDPQLMKAVRATTQELEKQLPESADAVGLAVAINGEVESVDVFATPGLFTKLRGKLLRAAATQAFAEKTGRKIEPPKTTVVTAMISEVESAPKTTVKQNQKTQVSKKENPSSVVFSTDDDSFRGKSAHKSYLKK